MFVTTVNFSFKEVHTLLAGLYVFWDRQFFLSDGYPRGDDGLCASPISFGGSGGES
jgi:hypothetical protein